LLAFAGAGAAGGELLFGVLIPYVALAVFVGGLAWRIVKWARAPVPFRISTTCGQQTSLPWIKPQPLECPNNRLHVVARMALEVLCFRSLFRNTRMELREGPRLAYAGEYLLWLGALAFHWSFLVILLRHFRFFTEPVPAVILLLEPLDGFFQVGVPVLYITDLVIVAAVTFLFLRRVYDAKLRYISLPADYFPLFLLLGIALSGILMRYFFKADIVGVKQLALGLLSFRPVIPEGIGAIFYIHLFLVSVLLIYFPFSKLTHMAGVFLSPTRNLTNDSRRRRYRNPWDYPVHVHTYAEWEEEFHDKIKGAGLPLERE
jgi:nitrate reductase gamma subunit